MISEKDPYVFSRTYEEDDYSDKVVVAVGANGKTTIDVSSVWKDGTKIRDYYTGKTNKVSNGKVTLKANENGIMLLEEVN